MLLIVGPHGSTLYENSFRGDFIIAVPLARSREEGPYRWSFPEGTVRIDQPSRGDLYYTTYYRPPLGHHYVQSHTIATGDPLISIDCRIEDVRGGYLAMVSAAFRTLSGTWVDPSATGIFLQSHRGPQPISLPSSLPEEAQTRYDLIRGLDPLS